MTAMRSEKPVKSRTTTAFIMLTIASAFALPQIAAAETVLRIGMTAADIPRTLGQPDQGFEGNRFTGLTMYDALTMWDLSAADKPSVMIPGLATEWAVGDADTKKWTFKLRPGVTFHDGSLFDAAEGADAKAKSQAAWAAFARAASGTGPWKLSSFTPRERLELTKNENYWDKARVPKVDKMLLLPMPEANARTAALLSGQVDWIEAPAPDAVAEIKQRGFLLRTNEEPHVWPWQFSRVEGSPWNDIRVRKAANLCVDREGLKEGLLAGLMVPATGTFEPGHPWRGKPTFEIKYDKPAAQKLMQEAGFGPNKKLSVKIQTSASGSGQMLPLPMNEYLQQALAECYFDVQLDVIEWNTLFTNWRRGVKDPSANGANATNVTYAAMDPFFAMVRFLQSSMAPPVSNNWGFINNPKFDELVTKARQTFDPAARDQALAELHAASVDDAAFLYVAHDVAPRAMSPKIKGFVQPKSWFVDFSPISMVP